MLEPGCLESRLCQDATIFTSLKDHGDRETIGKPLENHCKTIENHGKTIEKHGKTWENEGLPSGYVKISLEHGHRCHRKFVSFPIHNGGFP